MLARDDLRQLAQRITARYHLTPLDAARNRARTCAIATRVAGGLHLPFDRRRDPAHPRAFRRRAAPDQRHRRTRAAGRLRARRRPRSTRATSIAPRAKRWRRRAARPHPLRWAAAAVVVARGAGAWFCWPRTPPADARATPVAQAGRRASRDARAVAVPNAAPDARARCRCTRRTRARRPTRTPCRRGRRCWRNGNSDSADATHRRDVPAGARTGRVLPARHAPASTSCPRRGARRCCACARRRSTRGRCCSAPMRCVRGCGSATTSSTSTASRCSARGPGEYAALWRAPGDAGRRRCSPDGRGPAVDWVHAHLPALHAARAVLDARDARGGARASSSARPRRRRRGRPGNPARARRATIPARACARLD